MLAWQAFGWCPNGAQCALSHDTDLIILQDEKVKNDKRRKRKRQKEKKKGGSEAAEGSQVCDGAPENKIPHMEVDPEEAPVDQLVTEPCTDNTRQNEGGSMQTGSEGNCVREDNTHTATADDTNTTNNTNDGVEGGEKSDHTAKTDSQKKNADAGTHRAGFDAYMTGFIFAYSCTLGEKDGVGAAIEVKEPKEEEQSWLPSCLNKVYLSGKTAPLNVVKSTFSKSSKAHIQKMEMVWGRRT